MPRLPLPLLLLLVLLILPDNAVAWQQRVHYTMDVRLDTATRSIGGRQRLVYTNNSPDTLREVYYHLFYEAFRSNSMMDVRNRYLGGNFNIDQMPDDLQGKVAVAALAQNGRQLSWEIRETLLHATLAEPLLPGDSTILEMEWATRIPKMVRRAGWMSKEGVEYSMAQWYPKIAAYDRHGWHPDEYVEREFYGPFGRFDVAITIAASYILGGTGRVVNGDEVGCGYELEGKDTVISTPAEGSLTGEKTWRFVAENVHDFAWTADRDYVHQITRWQDVTIHLLYKNDVAHLWRDAAFFTSTIMAYFSNRFGEYAYDRFTVAQGGDGGMEYPGIILILGRRSRVSLLQVISHELGHQWYYAMIGTNETRDAWMDEGFTTYIDNEAIYEIFAVRENPRTGLARTLYPWDSTQWKNLWRYYDLAIDRYDEPLSINHDRFREGSTSSLVYFKGELVLRQLAYMLGRQTFDSGMRLYLQRWRFRQPEPRDFERVMEDVSGMRLDWFFQQWVTTTRRLDYAIDDISSRRTAEGWSNRIDLRNMEEGVMPLLLSLVYADGTRGTAFIPLDDWKRQDVDINLPAWRWVDRHYSTIFTTAKEIVEVEIDGSLELADIDRTNNVATTGLLSDLLPPSHVAFYRRWDLDRAHDRYSIRLRPTLWYAHGDGMQLGLVADGGYTFDRYNAKAGLYYNIGSRRVDHDLRYSTTGDFFGRLSTLSLLLTNADGVQRWRADVSRDIRPLFHAVTSKHVVSLAAEREVMFGPNYPHPTAPWSRGAYNWLELGYTFSTPASAPFAPVAAEARFSSSFSSATAFSEWRLFASSGIRFLGLDLDGRIAIDASEGELPAQRMFNLAGSTSRDMHQNEAHRLAGNIDPAWSERNRLELPGRGMLRSFAAEPQATRLTRNLVNARIAIGNLNLPGRWLGSPFLQAFDLKAYAAGAWIPGDRMAFDRLDRYAVEAGIIISVDPLELLLSRALSDLLASPQPIRLSATLPLFARSPLLPSQNGPFPWVIGISVDN